MRRTVDVVNLFVCVVTGAYLVVLPLTPRALSIQDVLVSSFGMKAVVLTLGLAIGVNSTIFSVLNGVLLRPLDYAEPDRLVVAWESNQTLGQDRAQVSAATYLDWRNQTTTFESLAVWRYKGFTLRTENDAERLTTVDVSPVLFTVLGFAPELGRAFTPEEGIRDYVKYLEGRKK